MIKHSLWETILTVLANLVSKFVTEERIVIRDSKAQGYCRVTVSKPLHIEAANVADDGKINIIVGKEQENG